MTEDTRGTENRPLSTTVCPQITPIPADFQPRTEDGRQRTDRLPTTGAEPQISPMGADSSFVIPAKAGIQVFHHRVTEGPEDS